MLDGTRSLGLSTNLPEFVLFLGQNLFFPNPSRSEAEGTLAMDWWKSFVGLLPSSVGLKE